MYNILIDLRSDTVTKPCAAMRKAMSEADVGDSFYGDDYTTKELEEYCANLFGTQAALFMISGTMANQVAIRCHLQAGEEIITDNYYHISYYEASATADLGKAVMNLLYTDDGIITTNDLEFALMNRSRSKLTAAPKLIWLENTINHYGGKTYPVSELRNIYNFSKSNNLSIHIDGARLLNACIADGISFDSFSSVSNSMIFCFSKALGAPAGAVLLGDKDFIEKASIYQKWYGGGMHQSGMLAAAAKYAISNNIEYIHSDHDNAKIFAKMLLQEEKLNIQLDSIMTNIVMFSTEKIKIPAKDFTEISRKHGVLLYPWSSYMVRAVMHKDISKSQAIHAAEIILKIVQGKLI